MARKLNTKLVAGIIVVAAGGGAALIVGPKLLRPSIAKLVSEGDAAANAGNYEAASVDYGKAASRSGNDIDLQIKYVDALEYTVGGDVEKLRNLRAVQAQILTNDPRSVPALRRVLAYQTRDVQDAPGETAFTRALTGTAERLLQLVPDDREARMALVSATFEPYARNLEVKADDVDKQRDAAEKLFFEKPDDGRPLRMAVQFRLLNAGHAVQNGDKAAAADEIAKAQDLVERAKKAAPALSDTWMAAYDVARTALSQVDPKDTAKQNEVGKQGNDALVKANELAKPADASFLTTRGIYLHYLELTDPKKADAAYRKLVEELPDDRQPRIMLAEFLARQPSKRDDALAVLDKDAGYKPSKPQRALESRTQHIYELIERVRRPSIALEALEGVSDPADRKKRIARIDQQYRDLSSDPETSVLFKPALLRIAGGLQYANGEVAKGITTLDAAVKQMNPDSPSSFDQDTLNDTLMAYAQAELRLGQTGEARPALQTLVQRRPENVAARLILADLLLAQRDTNGARNQVDFLTKFFPGVPVVEQMRLRLLNLQGDLKTHYKDLAETTHDQKLLKLSAAASLSDAGEIERLSKSMLADNPGDTQAATTLAELYAQTGRRPEAVAAVNAALKAKPDDKRLLQIRDALAASTPQERSDLIAQQIDQINDPYSRALAQADQARQKGRPDDAVKLYQDAEKLKPDNTAAYDGHFLLDVEAKRFDDADKVLKDLTRLNADQAGGALYSVQLASARATAETDPQRRTDAFKDVLTRAQAVAQQYRELATASLIYAKLLQQSGDFADAVDQFAQTLDKSPTNRDALVGAANCLMALDRRTEARQKIDAAAAQAPNDPAVKELQLAYELRFGDPEKAVAALQKTVEQRPDDPQSAGRLGLALEQVAADRTKAGDADAGKKTLARAADVYGAAAGRFPQDLRFLAAYANALQKLGRPTEAVAAVEKVAGLPENQSRPELAELLATQYVNAGKPDDAVRVLGDLVARVKPAPLGTVQRLAFLLTRQNRLPDALAVLDLRKDEPAVRRQRVEMLLNAHDLTGAREAVETVLAAKPDADAYLLAASVEMQGGDLKKADGFLVNVFKERPNDATALFYRGQIRANATPPDLDGARDDLVRARDAAPASTEVHLVLADVYGRRRERDAQLSELQKAWDTNHQSKPALIKLAQAFASGTPPQWNAVAKARRRRRNRPDAGRRPGREAAGSRGRPGPGRRRRRQDRRQGRPGRVTERPEPAAAVLRPAAAGQGVFGRADREQARPGRAEGRLVALPPAGPGPERARRQGGGDAGTGRGVQRRPDDRRGVGGAGRAVDRRRRGRARGGRQGQAAGRRFARVRHPGRVALPRRRRRRPRRPRVGRRHRRPQDAGPVVAERPQHARHRLPVVQPAQARPGPAGVRGVAQGPARGRRDAEQSRLHPAAARQRRHARRRVAAGEKGVRPGLRHRRLAAGPDHHRHLRLVAHPGGPAAEGHRPAPRHRRDRPLPRRAPAPGRGVFGQGRPRRRRGQPRRRQAAVHRVRTPRPESRPDQPGQVRPIGRRPGQAAGGGRVSNGVSGGVSGGNARSIVRPPPFLSPRRPADGVN